jgi:hypothetical protein
VALTWNTSLYQNKNIYKTVVTVGRPEKWKIKPTLIFPSVPDVWLVSKISPTEIADLGRLGPDLEFPSYFPEPSTCTAQPLARNTQAQFGNRGENR